MKRIIYISLTLLFFSSILRLQAQTEAIKKVKITDVLEELYQEDGVTRIVNFWATWCAPCVAELPHFDEVDQEHEKDDIKMILLAVEDNYTKVTNFIKKKGIQAEVWFLDEAHANEWIPQVEEDWQGEIPVTLVVNHLKREREFFSGQLSKEQLRQIIQDISQ